mmetsp:Transcript_48905/g.93493  ORF Transcript_48905/g.93493 Transcript_48905/m.93493 type:complete len:214 (-) Transcript_48905:2157-2798(-)
MASHGSYREPSHGALFERKTERDFCAGISTQAGCPQDDFQVRGASATARVHTRVPWKEQGHDHGDEREGGGRPGDGWHGDVHALALRQHGDGDVSDAVRGQLPAPASAAGAPGAHRERRQHVHHGRPHLGRLLLRQALAPRPRPRPVQRARLPTVQAHGDEVRHQALVDAPVRRAHAYFGHVPPRREVPPHHQREGATRAAGQHHRSHQPPSG